MRYCQIKFDILYIPTVESLVMDRFIELYNLNKEIFLKRTYSEAYSYDSEYYEQYNEYFMSRFNFFIRK